MDLTKGSLGLFLSLRVTIHIARDIPVCPSGREVGLGSTEFKAHNPRLRNFQPLFGLQFLVYFLGAWKEDNVFAAETFVDLT